jgi:hypothetical protein
MANSGNHVDGQPVAALQPTADRLDLGLLLSDRVPVLRHLGRCGFIRA